MRPEIPLILATLLALAGPVLAADTALPESQFWVGKTGIFCVQAPCPWRGISLADRSEISSSDLLWTAQTLPPLEADAADVSEIEQAWYGDRCLLIEGRFGGGRLEVSRIIGDCP